LATVEKDMRRLERKPIGSDWQHSRFAPVVRMILSEKSATFRDHALVCGVLLAFTAAPAVAGDFEIPWLRGSTTDFPTPAPYRIWSGIYAGGTVGADMHGVDFRGVPASSFASFQAQDGILAQLPLAQVPQLPNKILTSASAGGFVGYNYQIDDMVFGFEANYDHTNLKATAADQQIRNWVVNYSSHTYAPLTVVTTETANVTYDEVGSVRARAGWALGSFLPYAFGGVTFAQINSAQVTQVSYTGIDVTPQSGTPPSPPHINVGANYSQANATNGKYVPGFSAGLGVDYALLQYVFLRAEVEYMQLGISTGIKLNEVAVRTGIGVKF
jgi:outer membrane immunogenic protein